MTVYVVTISILALILIGVIVYMVKADVRKINYIDMKEDISTLKDRISSTKQTLRKVSTEVSSLEYEVNKLKRDCIRKRSLPDIDKPPEMPDIDTLSEMPGKYFLLWVGDRWVLYKTKHRDRKIIRGQKVRTRTLHDGISIQIEPYVYSLTTSKH